MTRFVVTGTDTGIGKTVFSAALAGALGLPYWKPIQSGLEEETDSEAVARLAGVRVHPETRTLLYADLFARWQIPVIVCARTALGTINHSLLTIEALKARHVPIHGIAFVGEAAPDSEAIIAALSGTKRLGRLPAVDPLTPDNLAAAFTENFSIADFS